jgi:hypothetical protein
MEAWTLAEPAMSMEVVGKRKEMQQEKGRGGQRHQQQQPMKMRAVDSNSIDHQILMEMGRHLLTMDSQVRQHEAVIMVTLGLPASLPEVSAMKRAGVAYMEQVKSLGKNHNLGSPHLRVWAAFITTMAKRTELSTTLATAISTHMADAANPLQLQDKVLHFRVTQMKSADKFKLQVAVAPELMLFWRMVQEHLCGLGAEVLAGTAPRGPHIRRLQRLMQTTNAFEM